MNQHYLNLKNSLVFGLALFCGAQAFAQSSLSRKQADELAAAELASQMAIQKPKAEADRDAKAIKYKDYTLKFTTQIFGEKPAGGRSLWISLHGGGGTTPKANDQQWENQKKLYQPKEGVYFVPRSPKDAWNMWHDYPMDQFIAEIIKDEILLNDVNPDKVYIMGYSAGGDGTFQLGPRLADHWAAVAMMAGHPGDAEILNLKNVPFTAFVGGKDAAYKRNELVAQWGKRMDSLSVAYKGSFIHDTHVYPDMPHWMGRKDTIALPWMAMYTRNALPKDVIWIQDDILRNQFYWLGRPLEGAKQGQKARVAVKNNTIDVIENTNDVLYIYLNDQLLNLDKKVIVKVDGKKVFEAKVLRNASVIKETVAMRMDKSLIFSGKLIVKDGKVSVAPNP